MLSKLLKLDKESLAIWMVYLSISMVYLSMALLVWITVGMPGHN